MMASDQFCLRWNNHQSTLISVFDTLLGSGTLVDCTLAAEGQYLKAHKVVLSACSPYLEDLLSQHYDKHPIVILKDVTFQELKSMLDYMYRGEVNMSQDQLGTFLKAAESLQLKGLSEGGGGESDVRGVGSTKNKRLDPPPPPRKPVPAAPTPQPRRTAAHVQPHLTDVIRDNSSPISNNSMTLRSREGSVSPPLRKRRRMRSSKGDDSNMLTDTQLENNSCDLPSQVHSTPLKLSGIVPNISVSLTPVVPSTMPSLNEQSLETDQLNITEKADLNSSLAASGLIKEKMEPTSEVLLEPKTEYLEEMNNEGSVEDLTLDDDDDDYGEMDGNSMDNMSSAGPSHTGDGSNQQGFGTWQMAAGDTTDEVFLAAQEAALGANRGDSQEFDKSLMQVRSRRRGRIILNNTEKLKRKVYKRSSNCDNGQTKQFQCDFCSSRYKWLKTLRFHQKHECGQEPRFQCSLCDKRCKRQHNISRHMQLVHGSFFKFGIPTTK